MNFSNSYLELGQGFFQSIPPTPVNKPELLLWNTPLAAQIGISEELQADQQLLADYFSGNKPIPGSDPIALAYAGHQFGNFVPQLGDGRAHLLGELIDRQGSRLDIQLKGSGQTAFSRNGDGRCALGPAVREFIMSEAMHALRIPTTRTLAVTSTGESVYRETSLPGAVVTRIASSHIRVGTFEFFAARDDLQSLKSLADYVIDRHYSDISAEDEDRYLLFVEKVMERQIALIVDWLRVGFIHGVMNTDNTAISGETIDYGPCAMMNHYSQETVFSSIDHQGRYAYGNQPTIGQWNMARFAETLLPLIDPEQQTAIEKATDLIKSFSDRFKQQYSDMMGRKLGLDMFNEEDAQLIADLIALLEQRQPDYTNSFDLLTNSISSGEYDQQLTETFGEWLEQWKQRVASDSRSSEEIQSLMRRNNPCVIPRNHQMEAVIESCVENGDIAPAKAFLKVLQSPYQLLPETPFFQAPPDDGDRYYQTFCGT